MVATRQPRFTSALQKLRSLRHRLPLSFQQIVTMSRYFGDSARDAWVRRIGETEEILCGVSEPFRRFFFPILASLPFDRRACRIGIHRGKTEDF